jgi:WD40 repeat protein
MRALEKDRARRYQSAAALADDLERHLQGNPILAGPPSRLYRVRKAAVRHRTLVVGFAGSAAAVALLIATAFYSYTAIRRERDVAVEHRSLAESSLRQVEQARDAEARERRRSAEERDRAIRGEERARRAAAASAIRATELALRSGMELIAADRLKEIGAEYQGDWEYRHLAASLDHHQALLAGHRGALLCGVFSPDQLTLFTSGADGEVRRWRTRSGELLLTLSGHSAPVRHLAISRDGRVLVSGSDDGTVRVWAAETGATIHSFEVGGAVAALVLSPDSTHIVCGTATSPPCVYRLDGACIHRFDVGEHGVRAIDWSSDGRRIAMATTENVVGLWSAGTWEKVTDLRRFTSTVESVHFSPDGRTVFTAAGKGPVEAWSARDGTLVRQYYASGDAGSPTRLAVTSSTARVFRYGAHGWLLQADRMPHTIIALNSGHAGAIHAATFSPDERLLVTCGEDATVRVFNAAGAAGAILTGHAAPVRTAFFSNDGQFLVTGSEDGRGIVWRFGPESWASGSTLGPACRHLVVRRLHPGPDGRLANPIESGEVCDRSGRAIFRWERERGRLLGHAVGLSADETLMSLYFNDGSLELWDLAAGQLRWRAQVPPGRTVVSSVFSPCAGLLAIGVGGSLEVWDVENGTLRAALSPSWEPCFDRAGRVLATSGHGTLVLRDAKTLEPLTTVHGLDERQAIRTGAFSPDGMLFAGACKDGKLRVWRLNGELLFSLDADSRYARCVAFSPDGRSVAAAGEEGKVRIWEVATGTLERTFADSPIILWIAYSSDGKRLATGSMDGNVRLWAPETGVEMLLVAAEGRPVTDLRFSPDDAQLIATFLGGPMRIWDTVGPSKRLGVAVTTARSSDVPNP